MFKHKEYSMGFKCSSNLILQRMDIAISNTKECMKHALFNMISVRKYRRGKNRCLRCGLKIK